MRNSSSMLGLGYLGGFNVFFPQLQGIAWRGFPVLSLSQLLVSSQVRQAAAAEMEICVAFGLAPALEGLVKEMLALPVLGIAILSDLISGTSAGENQVGSE